MALGAIELVDSSGIVLNPKGAAIQPSVSQGPGALETMSPMETMQEVFFDIRDGITNLGDIFKEKISGLNSHLAFRLETLNNTMSKIGTVAADDFALQEKAFADEQADQRAADRGANLASEDVAPVDTGDKGPGMIGSLKDAAGALNPANLGEKGKIALFGLIAAGLFTFAGKINEVIGPALKLINEKVIPAFKEGMSVIIDDIGPVFDRVVDGLSSLLSGLQNFVVGIFEFDLEKIGKGLKSVLLEALPNAISAFGGLVFSAVEGLLTFLGVDPDGVVMKSIRFIKESFLAFPENITNLVSSIKDFVVDSFTSAKTFITETIPQFFTDMKDSIVQGVNDMISFIVDPIVQLKDNIVDTVDIGIDKIKDGIVGVVNKVKDTFTNFMNGLKGMANAIIDKINLIPGVDIDKLEITPTSDKMVVVEETGDAKVAEGVALDNRARVEGNKKRALNYTSSMATVSQDQTASYDFLDDGGEYAAQMELSDKIRAQKLQTLLDNTLQNQELRANAEASKPVIFANSTKQGDVTTQTSVHSAEPSSDHSDLTAKALASAMMG